MRSATRREMATKWWTPAAVRRSQRRSAAATGAWPRASPSPRAGRSARDAGDQHPHGSTVYKRAIGPETSISRNAALRARERSRARRAQSRGEKLPFGNADSWAPAIQYRSLMDADRIGRAGEGGHEVPGPRPCDHFRGHATMRRRADTAMARTIENEARELEAGRDRHRLGAAGDVVAYCARQHSCTRPESVTRATRSAPPIARRRERTGARTASTSSTSSRARPTFRPTRCPPMRGTQRTELLPCWTLVPSGTLDVWMLDTDAAGG